MKTPVLHRLLGLLLWLAPVATVAQIDTLPQQPRILIGRERPAHWAPQGECRLDRTKLRPMVGADNPFFYDHRWDGNTQRESAQMSPERHLYIEQFGCERHHRKFTLTVNPSVARPADLGFYAVELFNMMNRVFYNSQDYWRYKSQFEQLFLQRFPAFGLNNAFNFQLSDYTFMCEFSYHPEVGSVVNLEIVNLPNTTGIRYPGVPGHQDDGWFQPVPQAAGANRVAPVGASPGGASTPR